MGYLFQASVSVREKDLGWISFPDVELSLLFERRRLSEDLTDKIASVVPGGLNDPATLSDDEQRSLAKQFDFKAPMFALERIALLEFSFDKIARGKLPKLIIDFYFFGSLRHIEIGTSVYNLFTKSFKSILDGVKRFKDLFRLPNCLRDSDCFAGADLCNCPPDLEAKGICPDSCYGDCSFFYCTYQD